MPTRASTPWAFPVSKAGIRRATILCQVANEVKIGLIKTPDCVVVGYGDPLTNRLH
jgi:hypothetical protein